MDLLNGIDPYRKLLAAVLVAAVQDARRGDTDARQWLSNEGMGLLPLIIPETVEPAYVLRRLMTGAA